MNIIFRTIVGLLLSFIVGITSGCAMLSSDEPFFKTSKDYTQSKLSEDLIIPDGLGKTDVQDYYLVPDVSDESKGFIYGVDKNVLAPMQVLTLGNKVRVDTSDPHSSVFVIESVNNLWNILKRYIEENNIKIEKKDPSTATILTDWIVTEDDAFWTGDIEAWRYRYRFILGSTDRPTENVLTVELLESQEKVSKTGNWRTTLDTGRTEKEMLNSIVGFMYVEDIANARQKVNESALAGIIVKMGKDTDGNPALVSTAGFEQVWARVPIAMKLLKVIVDDQDRSQGLYFIKFTEEGFFESLAFWSGDDDDTIHLKELSYRIQVTQLADRVTMTFINEDNVSITAEELTKNFPNLSKAFKSRAL